jgi:hypothetical protein
MQESEIMQSTDETGCKMRSEKPTRATEKEEVYKRQKWEFYDPWETWGS